MQDGRDLRVPRGLRRLLASVLQEDDGGEELVLGHLHRRLGIVGDLACNSQVAEHDHKLVLRGLLKVLGGGRGSRHPSVVRGLALRSVVHAHLGPKLES